MHARLSKFTSGSRPSSSRRGILKSLLLAAMVRDSVAAVVRTCPRAIPLAMITLRKLTHGFYFASHMGKGLRLKDRRSSAKIHKLLFCYLGDKSRFLYTSHCRFIALSLYLRNRKQVPCFYRVIQTRVEVWENEKCCGNTSRRRVFPQLFRVLPNFHESLYNSIETRSTCFLFLFENTTARRRKKM